MILQRTIIARSLTYRDYGLLPADPTILASLSRRHIISYPRGDIAPAAFR
jgi:hypothetical protein